MPEDLRETLRGMRPFLADPNASPEEKRTARVDLAISRRLLSKGVEVLADGGQQAGA